MPKNALPNTSNFADRKICLATVHPGCVEMKDVRGHNTHQHMFTYPTVETISASINVFVYLYVSVQQDTKRGKKKREIREQKFKQYVTQTVVGNKTTVDLVRARSYLSGLSVCIGCVATTAPLSSSSSAFHINLSRFCHRCPLIRPSDPCRHLRYVSLQTAARPRLARRRASSWSKIPQPSEEYVSFLIQRISSIRITIVIRVSLQIYGILALNLTAGACSLGKVNQKLDGEFRRKRGKKKDSAVHCRGWCPIWYTKNLTPPLVLIFVEKV